MKEVERPSTREKKERKKVEKKLGSRVVVLSRTPPPPPPKKKKINKKWRHDRSEKAKKVYIKYRYKAKKEVAKAMPEAKKLRT